MRRPAEARLREAFLTGVAFFHTLAIMMEVMV